MHLKRKFITRTIKPTLTSNRNSLFSSSEHAPITVFLNRYEHPSISDISEENLIEVMRVLYQTLLLKEMYEHFQIYRSTTFYDRTSWPGSNPMGGRFDRSMFTKLSKIKKMEPVYWLIKCGIYFEPLLIERRIFPTLLVIIIFDFF